MVVPEIFYGTKTMNVKPYQLNTVYTGIYGIYSLETGKPYIGQAQDLERRRHRHFWELRTNKHCNQYLQRAFNKYGEANFVFEVLELVNDVNKLDEREQYYLDYYGIDNLYNMCATAGSVRGIKRSEETLQKMRGQKRSEESLQNMRGRKFSEETKAKMRQVAIGRKPSEETLQKMRGQKRTEETKQKMSAVQRGRKRPPGWGEKGAKARCKAVKQIDKDTGHIIQIFDSAKIAAQHVGLSSGAHIGQVAKGKLPSIGGFKWEYVQ